MLEFKVCGQEIRRIPGSTPVRDSRNYLRCKFEFDSDWNDCTRTAAFACSCGTYLVLLDADDTCTVPWEASDSQQMYVSAMGARGDTLITTGRCYIEMAESGYDRGSKTPGKPSEDVYAQLLGVLKAAVNGVHPVMYIPSVNPETGMLSWTNDGGAPNPEPVDIRGPRGADGPQGEPGKDGGDGIQIRDGVSAHDAVWSSKRIAEMLSRIYAPVYGAKWDKGNNLNESIKSPKLVRTGAAADITTDVTNFSHLGTINQNYSNPFDDIYPWSGRRLCNIDLDRYAALAPGADLRGCITAWDGDSSFSYGHENGVWVYTPDFWGRSFDDGTYRHFEVCPVPREGYVYYRATIEGRWYGSIHPRTVGGQSRNVLLPRPGMPATYTPLRELHACANNYGATLDNIYTIDGVTLLMLVEYASMNSQANVGYGMSTTLAEGGPIGADTINGDNIKVPIKDKSYAKPGMVCSLWNQDFTIIRGCGVIESAEPDTDDSSILNIKLTADGHSPTSITAYDGDMIIYAGKVASEDKSIGCHSGYLDSEFSKSNSYYRGEVLWGYAPCYILGAYSGAVDNSIWAAASEADADAADALDTAAHVDTGFDIPDHASEDTECVLTGLCDVTGTGLKLSIPPFPLAQAIPHPNPIQDRYRSYSKANDLPAHIMLRGCHRPNDSLGAINGIFATDWLNVADELNIYGLVARPALKQP